MSLILYEDFTQDNLEKEFDLRGTVFPNGLVYEGLGFSYHTLVNSSAEDCSFNVCSFRSAILAGSVFKNCTFHLCEFNYSSLTCISFVNCKFTRCNFYRADLSGTDFVNCYIANDCDFDCACLSDVDLPLSEEIRKGLYLTEPMKGYKKATYRDDKWNKVSVVVELTIPVRAIVYSINNRKCRTNVAHVDKIIAINDKRRRYKHAFSNYDNSFVYTKGEDVVPDYFNPQYNIECAEGIHFFRTFREAENY